MNIKKFYLYQMFKDLMPIYPLYQLMFDNKGLSLAHISMLLAIWSVPAVLLEIPTGVIADHWSRRNLMFLGGLLKASCFLVWIFSEGFILYAVGFILWGISSSLQSGAEEALLYDSLKVEGQEERFDLILGRGRFVSGISNLFSSLLGGFIGMKFGFELALGLSVGSSLITAGIALAMKEVNLYKDNLSEQPEVQDKDTLRNALSFLFRNKKIFLFSLLTLIVITTAGVLDEYDQLIAQDYGLSIGLIGIWTAIRFILMAIGGFVAGWLRRSIEKILRIKDKMYNISFMCLIAALFLVIAGLVKHINIMWLYGLYFMIMSSGEVLQEDYIQQNIEDEGRSTVHSVIALSQNLYGIICFGLFGMIASGAGLHAGLIWCGVYIIIWTVVLGFVYAVINKRKHNKISSR